MRPRGHVLFEQPLVVSPTGVIGVGHLPDDVARLPFQILEREIEGQWHSGSHAGLPRERVVAGVFAAGRVSRHEPHGRRQRGAIPVSP